MLPTAQQIRDTTLKSITGTTLDAQIDIAVAAADEMCARYCLFPQTGSNPPSLDVDEPGSTYTLYFDGPSRRDERTLGLNLRPVVSITSVHLDQDSNWTYGTALVEGTDFVLDVNGKLYLHPTSVYTWEEGRRRIKVVAVAGFDVSTHAPTLEAVAILTSYLWNHGFSSPEVQTVTTGAQSVTKSIPNGLPLIVRQLLEPYRLVEREADRG